MCAKMPAPTAPNALFSGSIGPCGLLCRSNSVSGEGHLTSLDAATQSPFILGLVPRHGDLVDWLPSWCAAYVAHLPARQLGPSSLVPNRLTPPFVIYYGLSRHGISLRENSEVEYLNPRVNIIIA